MKIFVWSWNTQTAQYNEDNVDFIEPLTTLMGNDSDGDSGSDDTYDLIVVALQEDSTRERESFLVNAIQEKLKGVYSLQILESLSGWGATTYKALKNDWNYLPRGLRLAVFVRNKSSLVIHSCLSNSLVAPGYKNWITHGKGAVYTCLATNRGTITFINMHLPFSSKSILDPHIRNDYIVWQVECFNSLINQIHNIHTSDYVFIMGDLNFRVKLPLHMGAADIARQMSSPLSSPQHQHLEKIVREYDELRNLMGYGLYTYPVDLCLPMLLEGVANRGPTFLPTCKLTHERQCRRQCIATTEKTNSSATKTNSSATTAATSSKTNSSATTTATNAATATTTATNAAAATTSSNVVENYRCGKHDRRAPSWCDRILYMTRTEMRTKLRCVMYTSWEYGTMNKSDHSSVISVFDIV